MHAADSSPIFSISSGSSIHMPFEFADGRLLLPGARVGVVVKSLDLSGLAAGMLRLDSGTLPQGATEAAIGAGLADLAGVSLGGQITLEGRPAVTVVGIVEDDLSLRDRVVLVDPAALETTPDTPRSWLVRLPAGADPQAVVESATDPATGNLRALVFSRESGRLAKVGGDSDPTVLVLGALALVESALIASAAFAVSIRRRQRELGLLAAAGATPRQLAVTVLAEAAILGALAALAGVVVGVAGAYAASPWLDQLTDRRNPPIILEPLSLLGPFLIGMAAAFVAALVPARTAARQPVLLSLSGRRPPTAPARRTLLLGVVAIALAARLTVLGANLRQSGTGDPSILLLVAGAILGTLGFGACSPWLLERLEAVARRLPLAGRIALRDTARARSRSSPIVTVILAAVAATVALGTWVASRDAENLRGWAPSLYPDQIVVSGLEPSAAGEALLAEGTAESGTRIPDLVLEDPSVLITYQLPDAHGPDGEPINTVAQCQNCKPGAFEPYQVSRITSATPAILAMAHAESAADDLRQGRAVVLTNRGMTAKTLEILVQRDPTSANVSQRLTIPVRVIQVPVAAGILPGAFLPDQTIRELGLVEADDAGPYGTAPYVVRYDHPVTEADLQHAQEVASRFPETLAETFSAPVRPGDGFRVAAIVVTLLFALNVTGIAVALGEAEARPEQQTLLALGADPRVRRRIAASRAAVVALLAGLLAVPAGILPVWGLLRSYDALFVVPLQEIAAAVVLLPVLAVAAAWILSRPIPEWRALREARE